MGVRMGRRLVDAGHDVVCCDVDPARAAALDTPVARTPAEAFAGADVAITSLPSVAAVEQVVLGPGGLAESARPGATLIEMSTSSPVLARRLAAELAADVLDAPVSGGPTGAEAGTLTIMVGGDGAVLDRHRDLLACLGTIVHAGGHGAGQVLKLCNNLLAGSHMAALAEACAIAEQEGLDPVVFYDAVTASTGDSRVLRTRFPMPGVEERHPSSNGYEPLFALELIAKDLQLALELARGDGVATPVASAALGAYAEAQRAGHGALDYSAVYLVRRRREAAPPREDRRFPEGDLLGFGGAVLARHAVPAAAAAAVLDSLVEADRRGVHTHGLLRLPAYCAQLRAGEIVADAQPELLREEGPTALVDGKLGFGAASGVFAMRDAIRRAREHGVGVTAVRGGMHFGSAAHYSLIAAREGLIGLAACSTPAAMAPWGAAESRLGNNPVSVAAAGFALDIALSTVSRGQVKLAELGGRPIPAGWALDRDGRPTTDAAAALAGALTPVGGHKGSGLAMAVELLTAALAGAEISPLLANTGLTGGGSGDYAGRGGAGFLMLALDPERFAGSELFVSRAGELFAELKASRLAPGFDELLIPGELEHRSELRARKHGVPLPAPTVEALEALAVDEGIPFPPCGRTATAAQ